MTSKSLVALAAVLVSISAVPAFALEISVGGSASSSGSANSSGSSGSLGVDLSASATATADTEGDDDAAANAAATASADEVVDPLDAVIDLINASTWAKTSLSSFANVEGTAYDIGAWVDSSNSAALEAALATNADEIADLRYALQANAELSAWLDSENADASSVVAVGLAADGSLAVFTYAD